MLFDTTYTTAFIRWSHIFSGIIWVGFFFSSRFILLPYVRKLKGEAQAEAYRCLIGRSLRWCKGAGLTTFLLGIGVLGHLWAQGVYVNDLVGLIGRGKYIMWAMTVAVAMLVNLWFLIGPMQNRILAAYASGIGPGPADLKKLNFWSTINLYAAGPMLLMMVFAHNFASFHYGHLVLAAGIGMVITEILVRIAKRGSAA